jgi:hypothetical protein
MDEVLPVQPPHDTDSDAQDAEQWRKVVECVQGHLNGWKKKFIEGGKVLPPAAEIDDGIIVDDDLILPLPTVMSWGRGGEDGNREENDRDVGMVDATTTDGGDVTQVMVDVKLEVEVGSMLRSGTKRKVVLDDDDGRDRKRSRGKGKNEDKEEEDDEMLLRVNWACFSCSDLL